MKLSKKTKEHLGLKPYKVEIDWSVIVITFIFLLIWFYFKVIPLEGVDLSFDQESLGQLGDFFGGLLNPMVGLLTVFLILKSIHIQQAELARTVDALKTQSDAVTRQNFEQTFFSWLNSYRELISSVTFHSDGVSSVGRTAMNNCLNKFLHVGVLKKHAGNWVTQESLNNFERSKPMSARDTEYFYELITDQWNELYVSMRHDIDSPLRTLYRLIKWIDEQPENILSLDQKWHYIAIVRAQLSYVEMIFLFYNGFTKRGENFNKYVNKYALFDNLVTTAASRTFLLRLPYSKQYKSMTKGISEQAFHSTKARKKLGIKDFYEA